ncbi:MAG: hypothetical protein OXH19_05635 [Chloroflexi bacterium]|nr:hypothetical protein [Chloroflexota bacterium]MCY3589943.1 hypothetical protein [Chloroflexota bacterium]MCY3684616.1 hypothetical protein [Chloroflexota bacterium]MDE2709988.1 hypothetical protein [Chloroflexota bacterium]
MNGNEVVEERTEASPPGGEGRLWGLLQDLVAREGKARTAERLGVSDRTLRRTLESEHLSRRMTSALLREQNELRDEQRVAREMQLQNLTQSVQQLERRLADFERVTGEQLDELGDRVAVAARQATEAKERVAMAPHTPARWGGAPTAVAAPRPVQVRAEELHALVTVEPAPDDAAVYRDALPLVAEWRRSLVERREATHTYAWLKGEMRLLELELRLIDEYELTMPPADRAWDGLRRQTERRLRSRVLDHFRRQLRWTRPLHWVLRLLSLGILLRTPSLEHQLRKELQERRWGLLSEAEHTEGSEQEADVDT